MVEYNIKNDLTSEGVNEYIASRVNYLLYDLIKDKSAIDIIDKDSMIYINKRYLKGRIIFHDEELLEVLLYGGLNNRNKNGFCLFLHRNEMYLRYINNSKIYEYSIDLEKRIKPHIEYYNEDTFSYLDERFGYDNWFFGTWPNPMRVIAGSEDFIPDVVIEDEITYIPSNLSERHKIDELFRIAKEQLNNYKNYPSIIEEYIYNKDKELTLEKK